MPTLLDAEMTTTDRSVRGGLRSMTGQGRGEVEGVAGSVEVEIRSVNNRGLKLIVRTSDSVSFLEPEIESMIRGRVQRGTVSINVRWSPPSSTLSVLVNEPAIRAVAVQLRDIAASIGCTATIDFATLASLPGMLHEGSIAARSEARNNPEPILKLVRDALALAADRFVQMRCDEAAAMSEVLFVETDQILTRLDRIAGRTESVVQRYQERLLAKIEKTLTDHNLPSQPAELLREVQLFADRSDISEEITRLGSHLRMFRVVLNGDSGTPSDSKEVGESYRAEAVGRKLDFIIQEMFRETNTIGSKAADAEIAGDVVEIKCAIERMRELVQNIE